MNTCCSNRHYDHLSKPVCAANGRVYAAVNHRSLLQHVKTPWVRQSRSRVLLLYRPGL